ncbi:hypothetical protein C0991_006860 [Blastosporella zonata]|nr:hypothetical protein C0991_006860 [Blastosporella zonata]
MSKFNETDYTKIFSLVLDNGKKVVARLPTPLSGPKRLVTASQVATSEFARQRMGLPVPKTLVWSADAQETDVGAEFIIEEDLSGIELSVHPWVNLPLQGKLGVTRELWNIEKKMLDNPLPAYGSIFFREDVESLDIEKVVHVDKMFSVGPSVDRAFWADERAALDLNRGPWTDPYQYLFDICDREEKYIDTHGRVKGLDSPWYTESESSRDPDAHLQALTYFGQAIPYVVPTENDDLVRSTLSHPVGLDGTNVWLSESAWAEGRIEVAAITDWQHAAARPMYLTAHVPSLIDFYRPEQRHEGTAAPAPPPTDDRMAKDSTEEPTERQVESHNEWEDYDQTMCIVAYRRLAEREDYNYFYSLTDNTPINLFSTILHTAEAAWGEIFTLHNVRSSLLTLSLATNGQLPLQLRFGLYRLQVMWALPTPCPYHISEKEAEIWRTEHEVARETEAARSALQYRLVGAQGDDGWISPDFYDEVRGRYEKLKMLSIENGEGELNLFDDLDTVITKERELKQPVDK